MDEGSRTLGLLFQAVARARRESVVRALRDHGMEELEDRAVPCLLDGAAQGDEAECMRLGRVCWVVDERLMAGLSPWERAALGGLLRRMLKNLRRAKELTG